MSKHDKYNMPMRNKSIDKLTKGQKFIASQAGNPNIIEAADFAKLRKRKK